MRKTPVWRPKLNVEKFQQVVLFLLHSIANNSNLGKVKLFKLLYYVDFDHFEHYKASVTGDTYWKQEFGPVAMHAAELLESMQKQGLITIGQAPVGNYVRYVYRALVEADITKFSASEMEVLEQVAQKWAGHSREEIVAATHGEPPWKAVQMGDEIPYTLAFYRHKLSEALPDDEEPERSAIPF